jgi:hypothetical protein
MTRAIPAAATSEVTVQSLHAHGCYRYLPAKAHQGEDAHPLPGECGQGLTVPQGAACAPGEHGLP